ncbi:MULTISPECIES: glycosyl hydrolase 115 family protein [Bifidobacterium]|uniref:glycosyl hydrolase 115 family protein n=1 Tax=Bifidobacterium TaxID=1678 RepID=UPI001BDC1928|nr:MULTISPECIES: glycosyl hydrolase 115 family protein [Bifidobacterium]MBT1161897.1 glycosyl hydrolase 115 family protein [Bifidobacterium sp. SO1]MBW3079396.1 glycosyl hydrolase 115 family protein [Bifidobacterium simiiventris]
MPVVLNGRSAVRWNDAEDETVPEPVAYAIEDLTHDLGVAFAGDGSTDDADDTDGATISVRYDRTLAEEQYRVTVDPSANAVIVAGADDLGCIYGLYAISREWLGFEDFWFWNDQRPAPRRSLELPDAARLDSHPAAVRYRGWFVNDEVLIVAWNIRNDNELTWRMIFSTLLRCGGNLVIPGSGQNMAPHWDLAHRMGLYVNQHHATPLGSRLFSEAYPGLKPRWPEDRDKYEALWREAIAQRCGAATADGAAKRGDPKVVWTLGFRGSCDGPFWTDDPRYTTDEERGRVLSEAIKAEYDLVRAADPNAPVSTYLYSESLELYRKGLLHFPDDVIKIWSDNGYGRMMVRRNGNWDPREPAMPDAPDPGENGIYYHASFFDLQAANHITQMPESADDITRELETVIANGGDSLWVVNCSNVKPHAFTLDLIARLWRDGSLASQPASAESSVPVVSAATQPSFPVISTEAKPSGEISSPAAPSQDVSTALRSARHDTKQPADPHAQVDAFLLNYCRRYYGEAFAPAVAKLFRAYWDAAASFGGEWDQKCGEQLYTYIPRMMITHYLSGSRDEEDDLKWLVRGDFVAQIAWVKRLCANALPRYERLVRDCERAALDAEDAEIATACTCGDAASDGLHTSAADCADPTLRQSTGTRAARLIRDTIGLQSTVYRECVAGTLLVCDALEQALAGDFKHAFYHAGLARERFQAGDAAMRAREHGVWQGFWANDCLADVKFSGQVCATLMSYLRNRGDGPHYVGWKHEFCYSEQWRDVIVVLNMENHESDDEIFQAMKRAWQR